MADNKKITTPRFILHSPNFRVKFISGVVSELIKYETDLMDIMALILDTLEVFPTSVKFTEKFLAIALQNLILSQEEGHYHNIKVSVKLRNISFGTKKIITLAFTDSFNTEVVFHIKKKTGMGRIRRLKDLVVDKLKTEDDIGKLDVPLSFIHYLVKYNIFYF